VPVNATPSQGGVVELRLPPTARAPSEARTALGSLRDQVDPGVFDALRLLVTELVTNAVRHSRTDEDDREPIELRVEAGPDGVRTAVTDPGRGFRVPHGGPQPSGPSGWGLYLVDQMADRWGVSADGVTRVWFEIDRPASG
jgi:anti-sigma regulatory factor (Ser/Thr protein kinase)